MTTVLFKYLVLYRHELVLWWFVVIPFFLWRYPRDAVVIRYRGDPAVYRDIRVCRNLYVLCSARPESAMLGEGTEAWRTAVMIIL